MNSAVISKWWNNHRRAEYPSFDMLVSGRTLYCLYIIKAKSENDSLAMAQKIGEVVYAFILMMILNI